MQFCISRSETREGRVLPKFDVTHLGKKPYGREKRPTIALRWRLLVEPRKKQTMKMQFVTLTAVGLLAASAGMAQTTTTTTTTTTTSHVWTDPHTWWGNHWAFNAADRYT